MVAGQLLLLFLISYLFQYILKHVKNTHIRENSKLNSEIVMKKRRREKIFSQEFDSRAV
jgi:hypothetical protein